VKNEAGTFLYPTSETEFTIRLKLTYFLFLLSVCGLHAQVVFSHLPLEYQLIPREANNLGTFTVSGTIATNEFDRIRSVVTDDNQIIIEDKTVFADTDGKFLVTHTIQSVLKEYELKIYAGRDLEEVLVKRVTGIVCGDIYLIAGQSNAAAGFSHDTGTYFNAINKSHYNRGIGWGMDQALDGPVPMEWEYSFEKATSIGYEKGFTGAWGMRIQKLVSENLGVPICVVNGARSGSPIAFNLPSKTPIDPAALNTNAPYDRIYAKLKHFGYQNYVKAIFWYQGEKDGGDPADTALKYRFYFNRLFNSWKSDYPNVKKIFVFQINTGCGGSSNSIVREEQRKLQKDYPELALMSTVGSDSTERSVDGCHYTQRGHSKIANKLYPFVMKYIYEKDAGPTSFPPMVINAYSTSHSRICIEFDQEVVAQHYMLYRTDTIFLKDHFFGPDDSPLPIKSMICTGKNICLDFNDNELLPEKITYLPGNFSSLHTTYTGPWIMNAANTLGAFSFFEFPVKTYVAEIRNVLQENEVKLFPNPANGYVHIVINKISGEESLITLCNAQGQVLFEHETELNELTLDLKILSRGIYTVKVKNKGGTFSKKLVVL
jgi:hypothetical protein